MQTIRGVLAAAVLLVHLLVQAEGAKRTCPVISNVTTTTIALSPPIRGGEEPALLLLVGFVTNDRSACQCSLHEVIRGRLKLKARGNRCFGIFGVTVNEGMHRVSIECKKRRCPRVNETWDLDAKAIDCGHPGDIENGNVTYLSTFAGSFANYSCNDGYQLDPPYGRIRLCNQLGNWSGDIPTCVAGCGPPPRIPYGSPISGIMTPVGSTAFYLCDFDATLVGNDTIVCLDDGTWEEPPMCVPPVDCGPPPEITNGTVIGVFTSVGSVASYLCDFPTNLVGNDTIVCRDDGTWDDPPMCVPPEDCGPPPQIANGSVELIHASGLSAALYDCDFGYTLEGSSIVPCRANGMWGEPPICRVIQ